MIKNHYCAMPGCNQLGTMSNEIGTGARFYCKFHFCCTAPTRDDRARAWAELKELSPECAQTISRINSIFGKSVSIKVTTNDGRKWQWPR